MTTKMWAKSLKVPSAVDLAPIADYAEPCARSSREIARRAILLHGIVAVAYGVDAEPVTEWFKQQKLWADLTPRERVFISSSSRTDQEQTAFRWKQEAEWTLLWTIGKVASLALPTAWCDTRLLADEVMPQLGDDVREFVKRSTLRPPGALLAEDERTYNLWCHVMAAQRGGKKLPIDLKFGVLHQRRYVFEWINGEEPWDEVTCDS